ncbi:unnamed protein product [Calypogeia fissa]
MVFLEAASCSGAGALSGKSMGMEMGAMEGTRIGGGGGAVMQLRTSVRFQNVHRAGQSARPLVCASRTGNWRIFSGLKVSRVIDGRGFGRNEGRSGVGAVMIAARSFGGNRGPSRPRITTHRRPVQGEEPSSNSEPPPTNGENSNKRSAEVLSGQLGGSRPHASGDKAAQVLQDQFNRFAAAVALGDRKMAEEIIKEMGNGDSPTGSSIDFSDEETLDSMEELEVLAQIRDDSLYQAADAVPDSGDLRSTFSRQSEVSDEVGEMKRFVEDVTDLESQLEELYEEVERMIEEGDDDTARVLIEANYEAVLEQFEMGLQGVEQAATLDVLAQLYMNMDDFKTAEVLLEKTKELLERLPSPQPLLDSVLEHVASMYAAIEKPEEAIPFFVRSLQIQKAIYGKDSPLIAKTMLGLAKAYSDNDEGDKSIETYQQVLVIMERFKGKEDESLVIPLTHLGHTYLEEDRAQEAESVLQRAVRVTEKAYGARDGRVGVAICGLARAKTARGQVDEAVTLYYQGLGIMKGCSKFSLDDPVVEVVRTDLAELLNYLNRETEAQELWEENLRVKEGVLGRNDIQLVPHLNNAATSYANSGKFDKCEPLLRRSLKIMTVHFGPRAPEVSVPLELLATALHHLGRGFEGEPLAREAVTIRESHYGENHAITGQSYNCLAAILHGVGKTEEAEINLRKVLKIQERELGPDCPEIILTLELLVMLLNEQGRTEELQPIIRRMQKLEALLDDSTDSPEE